MGAVRIDGLFWPGSFRTQLNNKNHSLRIVRHVPAGEGIDDCGYSYFR